MPRNYYKGDPRWITARFSSSCRDCGATIARGDRAFYWPYDRKCNCAECGEIASARFEAEAADEYALGGF